LVKLEDKGIMIFGAIDCSTLGASSILGQFSQLITWSVARFGSWLKLFLLLFHFKTPPSKIGCFTIYFTTLSLT